MNDSPRRYEPGIFGNDLSHDSGQL